MKIKYFETLNNAFIAHFARRLADLMNAQGGDLLNELNLVTPASSVSTVLFLKKIKTSTVTVLAEALDVTQQMATQRVNALVSLSLIKRTSDPHDKRSKTISLTELGLSEAKVLLAFTKEVSRAFDKINSELDCDLKSSLLRAEKLLLKEALADRVNMKKVMRNAK